MTSPAALVDLERLGLDQGAHLLVRRGLGGVPIGGRLRVRGSDPSLGVHLRAWCRAEGHGFSIDPDGGYDVIRGDADQLRWVGAERAGDPSPAGIVRRPPAHWGLAARGALVEAGGPAAGFDIVDRDVVWADLVPRL